MEPEVQPHGIGVSGQQRCQLSLHLATLRRGIRGDDDPEGVHHPGEGLPAELQGNEHVLHGGWRRVADQGLDGLALLRHPGQGRFAELCSGEVGVVGELEG